MRSWVGHWTIEALRESAKSFEIVLNFFEIVLNFDIQPVYVFSRDSSRSRTFWKRNQTNFRIHRLEKCFFSLSQKNLKSNILVHQGSLRSQKAQSSPKNPPDWAGDDGGRNKVIREGWWKKAEKAGSTVSTTPTVPLHLVVVLPGSDLDVNPWKDPWRLLLLSLADKMPEPSESALGPHFGGWNGGATQNDRAGGGAEYSDISQDSHANSLQHRIANSWQSDEVCPSAYIWCLSLLLLLLFRFRRELPLVARCSSF